MKAPVKFSEIGEARRKADHVDSVGGARVARNYLSLVQPVRPSYEAEIGAVFVAVSYGDVPQARMSVDGSRRCPGFFDLSHQYGFFQTKGIELDK